MNYGLIGEKLGHSYSKTVQEKLLPNHTYELYPIPKDELDSFMKNKSFKGINVTIPYKQEVMKYLDYIDPHALRMGAVNTITHNNGELRGYNTDYDGFKYTVLKHNIKVTGARVLVLGNGGASKAVQAVLEDMKCASLYIVSRTQSAQCISYDEACTAHTSADIIVNTTPLGMYPHVDGSAVDLHKFSNVRACIDVVYNPWRTDFILQAKSLGIQAVGGLEMLVAQAKYALELFKNIRIDDKKIERVYRNILHDTSNLVFIGMPGSGKSTIARKCARALKRKCIDIDKEIVREVKMPIPTYFERYGEGSFRDIEQRICARYALQSGLVISCGGGIVTRSDNVHALQRNGVLIQLKRPTYLLRTGGNRPLSGDRSAIYRLEKERAPLYEGARDALLRNAKSITKTTVKANEIYKNIIKNYE